MPLTYAAYISIYDSTFKLAYWYAILTRWVLENNAGRNLCIYPSMGCPLLCTNYIFSFQGPQL